MDLAGITDLYIPDYTPTKPQASGSGKSMRKASVSCEAINQGEVRGMITKLAGMIDSHGPFLKEQLGLLLHNIPTSSSTPAPTPPILKSLVCMPYNGGDCANDQAVSAPTTTTSRDRLVAMDLNAMYDYPAQVDGSDSDESEDEGG